MTGDTENDRNNQERVCWELRQKASSYNYSRDSDKLCILLQGFVWETCVSDMKIVHKIRSERF